MSGVEDTLNILNDVVDIGTDMKDVADEEGTSDGAHKGWVTRRMGGTFEDQDELDKFKSKMVMMDDAGKKKLKDLEDRKEKQNKRDDVRNERHTTQVKVVDNLNDVNNWIGDEELKTLVPELSNSREDTVYERSSLEQLVGDGKIETKMVYDGSYSGGDVMYKAKDPNDSDEITAMKNHYGDLDYKLKYETNFKDVRNKLDDGELRNFNRDEEGNYHDDDWRKITWFNADNFLDDGTIRKIQVGALVQQMYEKKVRDRMQEERTPEEIEQGIDYLKKSNKRGYSWASKDDYSGIRGGAHLDAKGYDQPLDQRFDNDRIDAVLSEDEKNELSEIEHFESFTSGFLTQNVESVLQQMIGSGGRSPEISSSTYSDSQYDYEYGAKAVRFNRVEDASAFSENSLYLNRKATDAELNRDDKKLQDKRKNLPPVDLTQLPEW
tara:strand:- start:42 stop:1349 length:1308 start_codon:yes stop_codon:yes gene_type:complete